MSIDVDYAIKKDIRNNPVVREIDRQQKREFYRMVCLAGVIVTMLLFSAWQHFQIVRHGYEIEKLRLERLTEESLNRKLRLQLETLRAPHRIEDFALHRLRMVSPSALDTLVIERAPAPAPARAIVAEIR
jgi:cell division protein FtsL